ncbi:MAG: hypothetical protein H0W68_01640 [Gemmatimonadaceae bacterium]|nr:hypothetical protein [Gemmatimonadaceae bacterium]
MKNSSCHGLPCSMPGVASYLFAGVLVVACAAPRPDRPQVTLQAVNGPSGSALQLIAAPGVRINARLKPALELNDGRNIRFDASSLTPDSAYFAEPPHADVPGARTAAAGTLRVSVCAAAAAYCRTIEVPVSPSTITWSSDG